MKRNLALLFVSVAGFLLTGCSDGAPDGYERLEFVQCISNVDHSTIKSQDAVWWMQPQNADVYRGSDSDSSFTPRPGDSCHVYAYYHDLKAK
jgi:hypothetical protein